MSHEVGLEVVSVSKELPDVHLQPISDHAGLAAFLYVLLGEYFQNVVGANKSIMMQLEEKEN